MAAFYVEQNPEDYYVIAFGDEVYNLFRSYSMKYNGFYSLLPSRMLGLTHGDYLRYMRDEYEALLVGRYSLCFGIPVWDTKKKAEKVAKLLNSYWEPILQEVGEH